MTTPRLTEQEIANFRAALVYRHIDSATFERLLAESEAMAAELLYVRKLLHDAIELEGGIRPGVVAEMLAYLARQAEPKQEGSKRKQIPGEKHD